MKTEKIQPLGDRVIILPIPPESKTASGIIIPDTAKEKPQKGTIIYCGKGTRDEPMQVKVGDNVMYGKHAGAPINVDEKNCLIMRESDILAII